MSSFRSHKSVLCVLCLIVTALRLAGVHEHLCFDGLEPPVTLHFGDDAGLQSVSSGRPELHIAHSDVEIGTAGHTVVKRLEGAFDLQVLCVTFVLGLLLARVARHRLLRRDEPSLVFSAAHPHFRPPLRAPPRSPFLDRLIV